MSWLFSRALVAEYLGGSSSGGEPSAPLSVMPTQLPFLHNDKTTAFSRPSQYGLTCEVLTVDRGDALLTSYLAAFPARTSQPPAVEPASLASDPASGWKWPGSFAKYSPMERSWKTRQSSLLGGLESFSETWPRWGSMLDGECLPLTPWVPPTSASASGSWPTPAAHEYEGNAEPIVRRREREKAKGRNGNGFGLTLGQAVKLWGTPTARDHKDSGNCSNVPDNGLLGRMAKSWSGTTDQPGSLAPEFHLWLMGWPEGWNALEPLATDKYRLWLQQHGLC